MTQEEFWHWVRLFIKDNTKEILGCLFILALLWVLRR